MYFKWSQPSNVCEASSVKPSGSTIFCREIQPRKAAEPSVFRLLERVTFFSAVQEEKAVLSIRLTVFGILMVSSALHPLKAELPMVFNPSGSLTSASEVQPENALYSIVLTLLGISILVKDLHRLKQQLPIVVIFLGSIILVSEVQRSKRFLDSTEMLSGNLTDTSEVQPANA